MIELKNVTKIYPRKGASDVYALKNLSLTIPDNTIHGIVGESGAGKSTLIRCLTALERPSSGSILVDNEDLTQLSPAKLRAARRKIGMVFQGANLFDSRTVNENITYPLHIAKVPYYSIDLRLGELLQLVGLEQQSQSYPAQLSGGQRQRVGIARALADYPSVLLADEPTSALDAETTESILALLKNVREQTGVTVVVITHEMSVVRSICDSVTLLDAGTIRETGSIRDILRNPTSALARMLIPLPELDTQITELNDVVDLYFTSQPGDPTGSRVMSKVAEIGADIASGTFETVGDVQVGRLALTVPIGAGHQCARQFDKATIFAQVREV
ncbi:methionine ABC transporter ATP-binding protein [Arcanobacterium pinnipediorum]|uniref:ATP-binding cassette domain-containing protein n=1 Tax=Arcanobacterium pinnipediorum TaxID=1503041 RepID=A0ABY5AH01_9ACTO|nr:ATP-binding cassette domain-containing protein [Arcanobacterium pinnipediorum]USR78766.1 ATP-binding cassette domain-containing protein [Arcanobacterium pinnipediorum]